MKLTALVYFLHFTLGKVNLPKYLTSKDKVTYPEALKYCEERDAKFLMPDYTLINLSNKGLQRLKIEGKRDCW